MSILDMQPPYFRPIGERIGPEGPAFDPVGFMRIAQKTANSVAVGGRGVGGQAVTTNLDDLRSRIERRTEDLRLDQEMLARQEAACLHNRDSKVWEPPVQRSREVTEHIPDYNRLMDYGTIATKVSKPYWTRRCGICGKVEETTSTRTQSTQVPDFRGGGV